MGLIVLHWERAEHSGAQNCGFGKEGPSSQRKSKGLLPSTLTLKFKSQVRGFLILYSSTSKKSSVAGAGGPLNQRWDP